MLLLGQVIPESGYLFHWIGKYLQLERLLLPFLYARVTYGNFPAKSVGTTGIFRYKAYLVSAVAVIKVVWLRFLAGGAIAKMPPVSAIIDGSIVKLESCSLPLVLKSGVGTAPLIFHENTTGPCCPAGGSTEELEVI